MQDAQISAVLNALVTLTGEREPQALDLHYCDAVTALLRPLRIRVIRAYLRQGAWCWQNDRQRKSDAPAHDSPPPTSAITADLLALFESGNLFLVPSDASSNNIFIVPLSWSSKRLLGLLVEHQDLRPQQSQAVAQTLSVYRNHLRLLTDNQTDTLTGLLNRKTFDEKIAGLLLSCRAAGPGDLSRTNGACLAVLDIDHFKRINDRFGHLYGDEVLLLLSKLMHDTFRDNDLLFRFGGEEFVVVLRNIDIANAVKVFDRFRAGLEQREFPQVGKVTVSIGVVAVGKQHLPSTIVQQADEALYDAKHNGRNRVCCYEEPTTADESLAPEIEGELTLF